MRNIGIGLFAGLALATMFVWIGRGDAHLRQQGICSYLDGEIHHNVCVVDGMPVSTRIHGTAEFIILIRPEVGGSYEAIRFANKASAESFRQEHLGGRGEILKLSQ